MSQNVPAGWYPDHSDASLLRYWDGMQWTVHTHPAQPQGYDPSPYGESVGTQQQDVPTQQEGTATPQAGASTTQADASTSQDGAAEPTVSSGESGWTEATGSSGESGFTETSGPTGESGARTEADDATMVRPIAPQFASEQSAPGQSVAEQAASGQPGAAEHGTDHGFGSGTAPGQGPNPAAGQDAASGYRPGPGADPGYGQAAQSGHGQAPSYDQASYGQASAPGYGQTPTSGYGQPTGYGQTSAPGYGQTSAPGYGQTSTPGYGQPTAYGQSSAPGYGQDAAPHYAQVPQAGYGHAPTPGYAQGTQPYGQQPPTAYGYAQGEPPSSVAPGPGDRPKTKKGPIIAIVLGVLVLLGILLFVGIRVFGNGDSQPEDPLPPPTVEPPTPDDPDPTATEADDPVGPDAGSVQDGGSFVAGDVVTGSIETGGSWEATMTVEEDAMVVLDALTEDGQPDLVLELQDSSGSEILSVDDRYFDLTTLVGGSSLDPYAALWLEAGDYTVIIGTWMDAGAGDFELFTAPVNMIEPGHEEEITIEENQYIGRGLEIEEDGEYTLTATADSHDAAILLFDADGTDYVVEDPWASEAALTEELQEGRYMVVIGEPNGSPDTFTFSVDGP